MTASTTLNEGSAVSPPAIAYGQLGILLELLWRGERSTFAKCDFCQTLNHRFASRCEACAGKLGAAYADPRNGGVHDAELKARSPRGGGAVQWRGQWRELSRMMLWVLAMPLVLFVLFTVWQQWRLSSMRASTLQPPALAMAAPARTDPEPASSGVQATKTTSASASASASVSESALPSVPAAEQLARLAPVAEPQPQIQADAEPVARPLPASDARAVALAPLPARSERTHLASASPRVDRSSDPTAGCEGEMFLMRAICVNRRCAEPQNASRGRCVEAVRQRRMEEARRNLTPMG